MEAAIFLKFFSQLQSFPDFVIAYPKNHLQIKGQCVDAVS